MDGYTPPITHIRESEHPGAVITVFLHITMLLANIIVHAGSKSHPERILIPDSLPPSAVTLLCQKLDHVITSYETEPLPFLPEGEIGDELDQLSMGYMMAKWISGTMKKQMLPSEVLGIAQRYKKKSYYICEGALQGWGGCVKETGLLTCARCRCVRYCSVEHQRKDWKTHKMFCSLGNGSVIHISQ